MKKLWKKIEFKILSLLLKRHTKEMDQFNLYRFNDSYGTVYIEITREAPPGATDAAYTELP